MLDHCHSERSEESLREIPLPPQRARDDTRAVFRRTVRIACDSEARRRSPGEESLWDVASGGVHPEKVHPERDGCHSERSEESLREI